MKTVYLLFFSCCLIFTANSQESIVLKNPSFEGIPYPSKLPKFWQNCGSDTESPPDTQPGSFDVVKRAYDGSTFLGMVVRESGTWESVGQKLSAPLLKGNCYGFSIVLCQSEFYKSFTKTQFNTKPNFTVPIKLRIWGGSGKCDRTEILAETPPIDHLNWVKYEFVLKPDAAHTHLILEAFSASSVIGNNGNILLDTLSKIQVIPCMTTDLSPRLTPLETEEEARANYHNSTSFNPKSPYSFRNYEGERPEKLVEDSKSKILFQLGSALLSGEAENSLGKIAQSLYEYPHLKLVIALKATDNERLDAQRLRVLKDTLKKWQVKKKAYGLRLVNNLEDTDDWLMQNEQLKMRVEVR